jgi:hydroxylamine reductase (hybrid-cluster protein)
MPSRVNIEIERKFLIKYNPDLIKSVFLKEEIAQWYLNNSRIRLKVSNKKETWIKEKKEDASSEKRIEKVFSSVKDSERARLKDAPVVIKLRYYLDKEKKVSLDKYIFPEFDSILEIELNPKESRQYLEIEKSELDLIEKRNMIDSLFENKIRSLSLNYKELVNNEKTNDKEYRNYSIAKKLKDLDKIKGKLSSIFCKILKGIYL